MLAFNTLENFEQFLATYKGQPIMFPEPLKIDEQEEGFTLSQI